MRGTSRPTTRAEYEQRVDSIDGGRRAEIEVAFGEPVPELLAEIVTENDGRARPSIRDLNARLEDMDHYDHDEYGLVSEPTFYKWRREYVDRD